MCILFVHVDTHPKQGGYRLVIATNRDEYYHRPALDAHWCEDNVLGGEDMEPGREGGMWFGFATKEYENGKGKKHCAAALLNITGENVSNGCARGRIVRDYLNADIEFHEYVKILEQNKFSGFSLVAVEISKDDAKVFHYSNAPKIFSVYSGSQSIGFGNSPTYTPLSKVTEGRYTFDKIVSKDLSNEEMVAALLELLKSDTSHLPDEELQRRSPMAYSGLSSIFVKIKEAGYGTRAHSIILVDSDWNFQFIEHALKQPINIDKPEWNVTNIQSRL